MMLGEVAIRVLWVSHTKGGMRCPIECGPILEEGFQEGTVFKRCKAFHVTKPANEGSWKRVSSTELQVTG
eukprot:6465679-Amphidinium_carterae.2